jgi:hypothetical protein
MPLPLASRSQRSRLALQQVRPLVALRERRSKFSATMIRCGHRLKRWLERQTDSHGSTLPLEMIDVHSELWIRTFADVHGSDQVRDYYVERRTRKLQQGRARLHATVTTAEERIAISASSLSPDISSYCGVDSCATADWVDTSMLTPVGPSGSPLALQQPPTPPPNLQSTSPSQIERRQLSLFYYRHFKYAFQVN